MSETQTFLEVNPVIKMIEGQCMSMLHPLNPNPWQAILPIPTTPWLPLISDHIVTLEKDDVMDLQCVLLPFDIPFPHWQNPTTGKNCWHVSLNFIKDGLIQSEKDQLDRKSVV